MAEEQTGIYFDHAATTPLDARVLEAMLPYFGRVYGNASSVHSFGREAKLALERARGQIAGIIGAHEAEIVFTSGGTESDNLALQGVAAALRTKGNHLVVSQIEHHAVLKTAEQLEHMGFTVSYVPVDATGRVHPGAVEEAITDGTVLISVMHANNEVGTIQDIAAIGAVARERGILFHSDAVQTFCRIPIDVRTLPVDLLSFSGHKIYGPKGVGALYVRRRTRLVRLTHGGGHERNRRAGTENVPGAVGLGLAAELCAESMQTEANRLTELRDHFWQGLSRAVPDLRLNGHPTERLPGTLNVSCGGVEGESLLLSLDLKGIAVSSGSACEAGSVEPSHVLMAMGLPPEEAQASVRFTLGRRNTREEVDYAVAVFPEVVRQLRDLVPAV